MDNLITICTPTFNRAHVLNILYESLLKQSIKNFEWLIIDDGSTDETEEIVKCWIVDHKIIIRYYKKENGGKHTAINFGLDHAKGDYFLIVDSDDYLLNKSIELCNQSILKIESVSDLVGFTGIHFANNIDYLEGDYGGKEWVLNDYEYDWKHKGEIVFCYKLKIFKMFKFPVFTEEKFCTESLVHDRILNKYKVLFTDNVLVRGDYLEDGLTSKYQSLLENNPRAAMLSFKEKIGYAKSKDIEFANVKNYWNIAMRAKQISWIEKFRGISLKYSLWFWYHRLIKKNN